ncbi:hypothetical protein GCM10023196_017230 [Actinoallomurus vinaceus]|uniref:Uncharacterized protein n=1 Tax=Actinoallomurus vinaceus TaxID=1080074 RepID=A0ABP8U5D0_9ACTN
MTRPAKAGTFAATPVSTTPTVIPAPSLSSRTRDIPSVLTVHGCARAAVEDEPVHDRPDASADGMTGRPTGPGAAPGGRSYAVAAAAPGRPETRNEAVAATTDAMARRRRGTRRMRSA